MNEINDQINEIIAKEVERQVREICVLLTEESIVKKLEELEIENQILKGQKKIGQDLITVGKTTVPFYEYGWVYNPGPTCTATTLQGTSESQYNSFVPEHLRVK